jgi:hypothetical protein
LSGALKVSDPSLHHPFNLILNKNNNNFKKGVVGVFVLLDRYQIPLSITSAQLECKGIQLMQSCLGRD